MVPSAAPPVTSVLVPVVAPLCRLPFLPGGGGHNDVGPSTVPVGNEDTSSAAMRMKALIKLSLKTNKQTNIDSLTHFERITAGRKNVSAIAEAPGA